ncbi:dUTP diphosphatase [Patescibacteria group bacterium]|nr:dUTP diphosphatase [Patescibacteria group bacterium]MBU1721211.1 dUTP diphosphatase [Patescibacteria group bacterium]MBU1901081.1 dUTP diphosphatase [Patescibacteria group bacterium]
MDIKIKRMHEDAKLPYYAHPGDVGLDVFSREENHTLQPGERKIFFVGFALEFDPGFAAIIKDRSSLPNNYGIHTMGGVYDAGYRGEYNVQLINLGTDAVTIEKGQKIAQLVIFPVAIASIQEVDELADSQRGEGRLGSTGKF